MSTQIMAKCWPLQMPPTPKAVLISLADNANDAGVCWPSIPTICQRTCLSERTVHGAIKWLEANGHLRADRSNGRHTRYIVCTLRDEPPQELRPRSTYAPAADAGTPADSAVDPRRSCGTPPQELRSNRKEPSLKATVKEPAGQGTRLTADWRLSDDLLAWTLRERPDLDPKRVADEFRDYWIAKPGADGRKADWDATWRNWVRRQHRTNTPAVPAPKTRQKL